DERHRDHALYTAFAPLDDPHVAIAMVLENAGWGAGAAAPIARRVIDYLLLGLYPSAEDIAATQKGQSAGPIGKQRPALEVALKGVNTVPSTDVAMAASPLVEGLPGPVADAGAGQRLPIAPAVPSASPASANAGQPVLGASVAAASASTVITTPTSAKPQATSGPGPLTNFAGHTVDAPAVIVRAAAYRKATPP
ncbi:MAG: cell elongation-specific peptidoglycan D,D-transpeptidase, partial [Rhizobacter sp.]|nr:cell elongation-specific peptidoglycan D,D-transpeptidase [Rhizobacter sp.]